MCCCMPKGIRETNVVEIISKEVPESIAQGIEIGSCTLENQECFRDEEHAVSYDFFLIHVAVHHLNLKAVKLLADYGCNINAMAWAFSVMDTPLLMLVKQDRIEPSSDADLSRRLEMLEILLQNKADVNLCDKLDEDSPLIAACEYNRIEILQRLLAVEGINLNHKNRPPWSNTAVLMSINFQVSTVLLVRQWQCVSSLLLCPPILKKEGHTSIPLLMSVGMSVSYTLCNK